MHYQLPLLAEEDWTKVVIGLVVVAFWVIRGIAVFFKKAMNPGDGQRGRGQPGAWQNDSSQSAAGQPGGRSLNALEQFQREVTDRLREQQQQRLANPPPLPGVTPQVAAMQRRQAVQRQQLAARQAEPSQRAFNPPAMLHPELAAMQKRQAVQRKQVAARQAQPKAARKTTPPPIATIVRSAPAKVEAPSPVETPVNPRATRQALPPVNAAVLAAWMKPETLRKQFIITEIFQAPLSMRD